MCVPQSQTKYLELVSNDLTVLREAVELEEMETLSQHLCLIQPVCRTVSFTISSCAIGTSHLNQDTGSI